MPVYFGRRNNLTAGGGLLISGGIAAGLLYLAAHIGLGLRTELATWPRVAAHVDSASAVTYARGSHREATYTKRLWLHYTYNGWADAAPATGDTYSSDYGAVAMEADAAAAAGTQTVLVNPKHPREITLDPGYTLQFFLAPLIIAGIGLVFAAFAVALARQVLRQGWRSSANRTSSAPLTRNGRLGFTALMAALGVAFIWAGVHHASQALSRSWSPSSARIDSADVVEYERDNSDNGPSTTTYSTRAWLTYNAAGRARRAPLIVGGFGTDRDAANDAAARVRRAVTAQILVDSRNPYDIADARAGTPGWLGTSFLLLLGGVVGFGLAVLVWRQQPRTIGAEGGMAAGAPAVTA